MTPWIAGVLAAIVAAYFLWVLLIAEMAKMPPDALHAHGWPQMDPWDTRNWVPGHNLTCAPKAVVACFWRIVARGLPATLHVSKRARLLALTLRALFILPAIAFGTVPVLLKGDWRALFVVVVVALVVRIYTGSWEDAREDGERS